MGKFVKDQNNWIDTNDRFIAFLDIMGFKEMIIREGNKTILDKIEKIASRVQLMDGVGDIKTIIFSDSILVITPDNSYTSAYSICVITEDIFTTAFTEGVPIKGAIACGELTADLDKAIYFGRPLIDAYELQQELELYGVVLHHTAEKQIKKAEKDKAPGVEPIENVHISKYLTPLKSGKVNHFMMSGFMKFDLENKIEPLLLNLYLSVSGSPRRYVDNTMDFYNWCTKNIKKVQL